MIDTMNTQTADWTGTAVSMWNISPWAFVVLIGLIIVGLIAKELVKNTKITELIAGKVTVIDIIRADQIKSNKAREEQSESIKSLEHRITRVEETLENLKCVKCD